MLVSPVEGRNFLVNLLRVKHMIWNNNMWHFLDFFLLCGYMSGSRTGFSEYSVSGSETLKFYIK